MALLGIWVTLLTAQVLDGCDDRRESERQTCAAVCAPAPGVVAAASNNGGCYCRKDGHWERQSNAEWDKVR